LAIFGRMKNKLSNGIALSLLPQIILVQWLADNSEWVEEKYSNGLYPIISRFFRNLYGWLPFSLGDIIYTALLILAIRYCHRNRKKIRLKPWSYVKKAVAIFAIFYFTFNLVWGLNYYRQPISDKFNINAKASYDEIIDLTEQLITKTNSLQFQITNDSTKKVEIPYSRNKIFEKTVSNYSLIHDQFPFLEYKRSSIKKSMYSTLSSYMGIGGYLNPFTNEAQVNRKTPLFRFPVVSAHEIGHQVGYAKENETNFIGYLVTLKSKDPYFQYSANSYALSYCLNTINQSDKKKAEELYKKLNPGVIANYKELKAFHEAYENPVEPAFKWMFSTFLKANNQSDGVNSYSRVLHLLVGYHEKYPL